MFPRKEKGIKTESEERVVQTFPSRCPYCDDTISYDAIDLKPGENAIVCPSCHRTFIKVVGDLLEKGKPDR